MKKGKRILVTGAAGAVGIAVIDALLSLRPNDEIVAFDLPTRRARRNLKPYRNNVSIIYGNIVDKQALSTACQSCDGVIHLAAVIPPLADEKPNLAEEVNIEGTRLLVSLLEKEQRKPFLLFSSSISVYGDRVASPWISVGDPLIPSLGDEYAHTKIKAEEIIRNSKLDWSIFRLTAIMGPKAQLDPLFFHMPLDTSMEILSTRDTGFAFAQALSQSDNLNKKTFNLSGGDSCRTSYREFLNQALPIFGLSLKDFPDHAFADKNFHCGYYRDSNKLNDILHFQHDSLQDYYEILQKNQNLLLKRISGIFKNTISKSLLKKSEPLKAREEGIIPLLKRFYHYPGS